MWRRDRGRISVAIASRVCPSSAERKRRRLARSQPRAEHTAAGSMSSRRGAEGAKLLLRMFGGRTKRGRQANLLEHAEHVMKSGLVEEPLWLDVMRK
jgi:hypothetical protein